MTREEILFLFKVKLEILLMDRMMNRDKISELYGAYKDYLFGKVTLEKIIDAKIL